MLRGRCLPLLMACLSACLWPAGALATGTAEPGAKDAAINRVLDASLRWLSTHYARDDTRSIVVDRATTTPAGAEVRGRMTWKTACPPTQHWHFFFNASGVMDAKRSFVVRKESPRCRPAPPDAASRRARSACDVAVQERLNVNAVKLSTEETTRFGDGSVHLRGTLTSGAADHEWFCKIDGKGRIRDAEDDVRVRPR